MRQVIMGALGGIYNLREMTVDEQLLAALGRELSRSSPNGVSGFAIGPVGMVYMPFAAKRESGPQILPLVSSAGHIMCWEGRLDNRAELKRLMRYDLYGDYTDVAIVLASYLRWRVDFLRHLKGDFALSLWDPASRMLLLARASTGINSLFYLTNGDRIAWASSPAPLLEFTKNRMETNVPQAVGQLIIKSVPKLIPHKRLSSVQPGSAVAVQNGYLRMLQFSKPHNNVDIIYQ